MTKKEKLIKEICFAMCKEDGCNPNAMATTLLLEQYGNIKIIPKNFCTQAWKFYIIKATIAYDILKPFYKQ